MLLKARRKKLHGKIAKVIEEHLPNVGATEPELSAHHYTEAKQPEKAIPLWQKAGSLALNRMALAEAIAHLNKGLDLVAALPASPERDGKEVHLRVLLGTAWTALKGWPAEEVWDSFFPALGLAHALRRNDALLPIVWGLFIHVLTRGRIAELLRWVTQLMNAAETYGDPELLIVGHVGAVMAHFVLGDPIKTQVHADRVLALYSAERHGHLADILNHDPQTVSLIYSATSTWMRGFPEAAVRISDAKDDHARRRRHPFDLGWALTTGAQVFDYLRQPDGWLKRIDEADRVGRENSLPFLTEWLVPVCSGMALIRKGANRRRDGSAREGPRGLGGGRW